MKETLSSILTKLQLTICIIFLSTALYILFKETSSHPKKTLKQNSTNNQPQAKDEVMLLQIPTTFYLEYIYSKNVSICVPDPTLSVSKNFEQIGFATKRMGIIYFDCKGNIVNDFVPVFVKKNEFILNSQRK